MVRESITGCTLCDRELAEPEGGWVYRDQMWSVGVVGGLPDQAGLGSEIPGWLHGQLRRHAEGLGSLNIDELASLGPLLAKLYNAVTEVTRPEAVYVVSFVERFPHWHFAMLTRGSDVPPEHRAAALVANSARYSDRLGAFEAGSAIRQVLRRDGPVTN